MGRTAVRSVLQTYLSGLNLPYVGTVYPARTYVNETDYDQVMNGSALSLVPAGSNYGCVVVINLPDDTRTRKADTGRGSVQDADVHATALELFFASTSGVPIDTQIAYDATVDAIFAGIRSDPLLGNPQVIWSAAEFETGLTHTQSEPYTDEEGMTVFITGVIRFDTWEWIVGQGV